MQPDRNQLQSPAWRPAIDETLTEVCLRLDAEEASLWCLSPDGSAMDLAANHGPHAARLEGLSVPIQGSVVGLVQATRMATAIGPEDAHHEGVDLVSGVVTRAMVAAPVMGSSGVLGVVSAINPRNRSPFGGRDLEAVMELAAALGKALEALHG
jgi:GAF domain-containing protein